MNPRVNLTKPYQRDEVTLGREAAQRETNFMVSGAKIRAKPRQWTSDSFSHIQGSNVKKSILV